MRYQLFDGDILALDIENYQKVKIKGLPKFSVDSTDANKEIAPFQMAYSLEEHLTKAGPSISKVFEDLKERILGLDRDIEIEPKKLYVAFKMTRNVTDVVFQKRKLWVYINLKTGTLEDSRGIAEDLATPVKVGHWGNGDYRVDVNPKTDLDYLMELIAQSYNFNR